jgi:hypothetical protein
LSNFQERIMYVMLRMVYLVLILIVWIFKKNQKKYYRFSQDQKTAASVMSNEQSQCILPWSSKNKQNQGNRVKRKDIIPTSLLNTTYWRIWFSLVQKQTNKQDLHPSIIETEYKEYFPANMNIYFIWNRQEHKRLSGIPEIT